MRNGLPADLVGKLKSLPRKIIDGTASDGDMFDFNRVEITGIVIISIIVMVVMWFLTDLSGTDRLINTVIAGVVAAIAASISLLVAHQFDIDVWR